MLYSGGDDQMIKIWSLRKYVIVFNLMGHIDSIQCIVLTDK
jgi:hypothetical protein